MRASHNYFGVRHARLGVGFGAVLLLGSGDLCAVQTGAELPALAHPSILSLESRGQAPVRDGEVYLAAMINQKGRVTDWLMAGSSLAALEPVAVELLRQAEFTPARFNGQPVPGHVGVRFSFSGGEPNISMMDVLSLSLSRYARGSRTELAIYQRDALDQVPQLLQDVRPHANAGVGVVKLEYFIDQEGRVRLPAVVTSDDADLSRAVLDAVAQWRFNVPQRTGRPVIALVRQEFRFHPGRP